MKKDFLAPALGGLGGAVLAAAGGWALYSRLFIDHRLPLPDAIPAERVAFFSKSAGRLNYYVERQASGRPLVLLHSVNAAASAYEMRPLFDLYRTHRPVFALDLPGYGFSERKPREYTPHTFEEALLDLLETQVGEQADVVALSLSCEFAARAAVTRPELFHSLALISPSGLGSKTSRRSYRAGRAGRTGDGLHRLLSVPFWSRALFDLIATRASIAFFLSKSFSGPVAPGLVDYAYAASHQPGAEIVPLHFLSGRLFSRNIREIAYAILEVPTLVLYDRDAYTSFDALPDILKANSRWRAVRIAGTLGLPHFEKPAETAKALEDFWQELGKT